MSDLIGKPIQQLYINNCIDLIRRCINTTDHLYPLKDLILTLLEESDDGVKYKRTLEAFADSEAEKDNVAESMAWRRILWRLKYSNAIEARYVVIKDDINGLFTPEVVQAFETMAEATEWIEQHPQDDTYGEYLAIYIV